MGRHQAGSLLQCRTNQRPLTCPDPGRIRPRPAREGFTRFRVPRCLRPCRFCSGPLRCRISASLIRRHPWAGPPRCRVLAGIPKRRVRGRLARCRIPAGLPGCRARQRPFGCRVPVIPLCRTGEGPPRLRISTRPRHRGGSLGRQLSGRTPRCPVPLGNGRACHGVACWRSVGLWVFACRGAFGPNVCPRRRRHQHRRDHGHSRQHPWTHRHSIHRRYCRDDNQRLRSNPDLIGRNVR
ncbi:hypothetical protein HNR40_005898 [Nonomuraea endophytica]|uniref:Uncharacterized protein n=1 Tax=Nonomuraea endophytica TaxID=714136 RepID=A0A7W8EID9_9ACTN|nr:hypothetical protein [Nonomuraea endophytica]